MHGTAIARDAFARTTLVRTTTPAAARQTCPWCGRPGKYRYRLDTDGGRTFAARTPLSPIRHDGPWCSISCFRAWHD